MWIPNRMRIDPPRSPTPRCLSEYITRLYSSIRLTLFLSTFLDSHNARRNSRTARETAFVNDSSFDFFILYINLIFSREALLFSISSCFKFFNDFYVFDAF